MTELTNAQRIVLLAASLEDWLPGPWMGRWASGAEGPSRKEPCAQCKGEGSVNGRHGPVRCEDCAGKGSVLVDAYTGRVVEKVDQPLAEQVREALAAERGDMESSFEARRRARDRRRRMLASAEGQPPEDWVDLMLRRKRSQYHRGDYERLEWGIARLGDLEAVAFLKVYGPEAADRVPGPRLRARAELALAELDRLLPDVRVPEELLHKPRTRDDEIRRLNARRLSQAQIAREVGVSQQTVSRVLKARVA